MTPIEINLNTIDLIFIVAMTLYLVINSIVREGLIKEQRKRIALLEDELMIDHTNQVANGVSMLFKKLGFIAVEVEEDDSLLSIKHRMLQEAIDNENYEAAARIKSEIEQMKKGGSDE